MITDWKILNGVIACITFGMVQVSNEGQNCKQISMVQRLFCNLRWMVNLLENFRPQWKLLEFMDLGSLILMSAVLEKQNHLMDMYGNTKTRGRNYKYVLDLCGNINRFGEVSDLRLLDSGNGKWTVFSRGRQLTNVRF